MHRSGPALGMFALALAVGCRGEPTSALPTPSSTLTAAQETATKEYVALLERQIDVVEEMVAVLATIGPDVAARETAKSQLLRLSVESEAVNRRAKEQQPQDRAVFLAAQERILQRQERVLFTLRFQLKRIREELGPDFLEKELQPVLKVPKGG